MRKVALIYDFDLTLTEKNMHEFGLFDLLNCDSDKFWEKSNKIAEVNNMDHILASMYSVVNAAVDNNTKLSREILHNVGKNIKFYPGVETWFDRINEYGTENNLIIEHYIISSGLKEIIEGTSIYSKFKRVYACEYLYDSTGKAIWPSLSINYTGKTQYLFRINKQALEPSDHINLNKNQSFDERPIPFENIIYIGDGFTDVPCMKLVKKNNGHSIAIKNEFNKKIAKELLEDERVNFICNANYEKNSQLDSTVKLLLNYIARRVI